MTQRDASGRGGAPIQLFIRMNPPWLFIDEIRRFVESFCACASLGPDREAQVALAVHELMQNAVPHERGEGVELDLEVDPRADRVVIRVTNECAEAHFAGLAQRVEAMYREPDALAHYLRTMKEQPLPPHGGTRHRGSRRAPPGPAAPSRRRESWLAPRSLPACPRCRSRRRSTPPT